MRISPSTTETGSTAETSTDEQWRALLPHLPTESAVNTPRLREIAEAIPQLVRGHGFPATDSEDILLYQSAIEHLSIWAEDESFCEEVCALANLPSVIPSRNEIIELTRGVRLSDAVRTHAENHREIVVRRLAIDLYVIAAPSEVN